MPGLEWSTENPGECSGKPDRTPWDRCVGFEMNASGAAIPRSSCVLNADGKPVLPASKPGAFTTWPCRRHGKALFNSIQNYPCALPLPAAAQGRHELSGDAQLARVRERITNRDGAPPPAHGPGASTAGNPEAQQGDEAHASEQQHGTLLRQ